MWSFTKPPESTDLSIVQDQVAEELSRTELLRLKFRPVTEAHFEAATSAARAWNIRLTVPLGLIAYLAFSLVDATLLPDLGSVPLQLRAFLIVPIGLFAMWMCSRVGAAFREAFIAVGITVTMLLPVGFMLVSKAPLAPYTTLVVILVSMHGNITMRLRFHWACAFSCSTVAAMLALLWLRPDLPSGLRVTMIVATLTCVAFGIVANNQLERAERRSFLLTLRETLRALKLSADKDSASALSLVDPLTGLANRRAFDAALARLWRDWRSHGHRFAVIMIDVDFFKRYNDHHGHPAGDECLSQVGQVLRKTVARQRDLVARYGGEEFIVLLAESELTDASTLARRLCDKIEQAGIAHGNRDDGLSSVTISAGVSSLDDISLRGTPDELLSAADRRLYAAKRGGRNRAVAA